MLLSLILLALGTCFLTIRVMQYRGVDLGRWSAVAAALAEAGMEDARIKLARDPAVLASTGDDQRTVSWSEKMYDGSTVVGAYAVTVDVSRRLPPYGVVVVTAVGTAGPLPASPRARRILTAEIDVSPTVRGNVLVSNPSYFRVINWRDSGCP